MQIEFSIEPYNVPYYSVVCQNVLDASQYCDCTGDCVYLPQFCQCEEAQAPTCCGGFVFKTAAPTDTFSPTKSMSPTYSPTTMEMCQESKLSYFQDSVLDAYDTDNSTSVSNSEIEDYYSGIYTEQEATEIANARLNYYDTDGDGEIFPEEYAEVVCNPQTFEPSRTFSPSFTMSPSNAFVNCGGHSAASCEDCPWDEETWNGEDWCNGECSWRIDSTLDRGGECVLDSD